MLAFRFSPAFLSRPLRGHPPPGGGDFFRPVGAAGGSMPRPYGGIPAESRRGDPCGRPERRGRRSLRVSFRPTPPQRGGKNSLSRGEGGPRQRVGRGMRAVIYKSVQHNRPIPGVIVGTRSRSLDFLSSSITARIPLQSEKRSFRTVFLTARNCGVIAPGNHWIIDSLRGAPPPGEAILRRVAAAGDS